VVAARARGRRRSVKCIVVVDDRKITDDGNGGESRNIGDNREAFDDKKENR
jgi:hypothetical protein